MSKSFVLYHNSNFLVNIQEQSLSFFRNEYFIRGLWTTEDKIADGIAKPLRVHDFGGFSVCVMPTGQVNYLAKANALFEADHTWISTAALCTLIETENAESPNDLEFSDTAGTHLRRFMKQQDTTMTAEVKRLEMWPTSSRFVVTIPKSGFVGARQIQNVQGKLQLLVDLLPLELTKQMNPLEVLRCIQDKQKTLDGKLGKLVEALLSKIPEAPLVTAYASTSAGAKHGLEATESDYATEDE